MVRQQKQLHSNKKKLFCRSFLEKTLILVLGPTAMVRGVKRVGVVVAS
jgi:hypothetical protein